MIRSSASMCLLLLSWLICGLPAFGQTDTTEVEREACAFLDNNEFDSAKIKFTQVLEQAESPDELSTRVRAAIGLSKSLIRLRDYEAALHVFTKDSLLDPEAVTDEKLYALLCDQIATAYYFNYDAFSAFENFTPYYDYLLKQGNRDREMMDAARTMTIYLLNAGLMSRAAEYAKNYKELSLDVVGEISEPSADASNFRGMLSRYIGEPTEARIHYEQALRIADTLNAQGARLPSNVLLSNIGVLYMNELNDLELAMQYFRRSLNFLNEYNPNPYDLGNLYSKFAQYYAHKGAFDSALYYIDRSIEILMPATRAEMAAYSKLSQKAEIYFKQGDFQKSIDELHQARLYRLRAIPGNSTYNWSIYEQMGKAFLELHRPDSALHYFTEGLFSYSPELDRTEDGIPVFSADHPEKLLIIKLLHGKATALVRLYENGDEEAGILAYAHYEGLMDWLNKIRSDYVYGESKTYLAGNMQEIIDEAVSHSINLYSKTDDLRYLAFIHFIIESGKWTQLKEEILVSRARSGSSAWQEKYDFLENRLLFIDKQLNEPRGQLAARDSLDLLTTKNDILDEIRELQNEHFAVRPYDPVPLEEIRNKLLEEDQVISEFLAGKTKLHQLIISKNNIEYIGHENPEYLGEQIRSLRLAIRNGDSKTFKQTALALYDQLVRPVRKAAPLAEHLLVIPDAAVANLPFDALLTSVQENEEGFPASGYLIQEMTTSKHIMMESIWGMEGTSSSVPKTVLAFSPNYSTQSLSEVTRGTEVLLNLPHAVEECQTLAAMFNGKAFIGTDATESRLRDSSTRASIIHLATHAVISEDNPDQSYLLLSPDSLNDGFLYAYEIFTLDLESDLATLSACNTGMGEYRTGEGNMSLARGFYMAGTRSVLMSLWLVEDRSTADLMKLFYEELEEGHPKDEALHNAKLAMLENADNVHKNPLYWAGFDIVGDPQPLSGSSPSNLLLYVLGGSTLLFISIWAVRRSRA